MSNEYDTLEAARAALTPGHYLAAAVNGGWRVLPWPAEFLRNPHRMAAETPFDEIAASLDLLAAHLDKLDLPGKALDARTGAAKLRQADPDREPRHGLDWQIDHGAYGMTGVCPECNGRDIDHSSRRGECDMVECGTCGLRGDPRS